jgi:hypothetical protein
MNSIAFLKAAYIIAWVVYVGYLGKIIMSLRRVEGELQEMKRLK